MPAVRVSSSSSEEAKCVQCFINNACSLNAIGCLDTCRVFCKACLQLSFRNPLVCPYHGHVQPPIGHENMYAVLIAGYEKEEEKGEFTSSVMDVKCALSDPQVMAVRPQNIFTVLRDSKRGIEEAFKSIKEGYSKESKCPLSVILYYCGHGGKINGKYSFKTGCTESEYIIAPALKALLTDLHALNLLVMLDCCCAENFQILPTKPVTGEPKYWYALWASSSVDEDSWKTGKRLHFTQHLLCALRSSHKCFFEKNPTEPCTICTDTRKYCVNNDNLKVSNIQDIVYRHIKKESEEQNPHKEEKGHLEMPLAYTNTEPVPNTVWYQKDDEPTMPLNLPPTLNKMDHIRRHLMEQLIDLLPKGLTPDHLMLTHRDKKEIFSPDELKKHVADRGELVMVHLRTPDDHIRDVELLNLTNSSECLLYSGDINSSFPFVLLHEKSQDMKTVLDDLQKKGIVNKTPLKIVYTPASEIQVADCDNMTWSSNTTAEKYSTLMGLHKGTEIQHNKSLLEKMLGLLHPNRRSGCYFQEYHLFIKLSENFVEFQEKFRFS